MKKIEGILHKAVGHDSEIRGRECDCLWCRKGGTFEQASDEIKKAVVEAINNAPFYEYGKVGNTVQARVKSDITKAVENL